jgi:hypothetical protein
VTIETIKKIYKKNRNCEIKYNWMVNDLQSLLTPPFAD